MNGQDQVASETRLYAPLTLDKRWVDVFVNKIYWIACAFILTLTVIAWYSNIECMQYNMIRFRYFSVLKTDELQVYSTAKQKNWWVKELSKEKADELEYRVYQSFRHTSTNLNPIPNSNIKAGKGFAVIPNVDGAEIVWCDCLTLCKSIDFWYRGMLNSPIRPE